MSTLFDATDELGAIVAKVARMQATTREKGAAYPALLRDAEQAQRWWAREELDAIEAQGSQHRFKLQAKRRGWVSSTVKRGNALRDVRLPELVSVRRGGEWMPVVWHDLTQPELDALVASRRSSRDNATDRLEVIRRMAKFYRSHPAATLGDAMASAGVTLDQVVAR